MIQNNQNKLVITEKVFDFDKNFQSIKEFEFSQIYYFRPRRDIWLLKKFWETVYKNGHSPFVLKTVKEFQCLLKQKSSILYVEKNFIYKNNVSAH